MGTLRDEKYYDNIYRDSQSYAKHYSESHYRFLWNKVLSIISDNLIVVACPFFLEIGCGPGQFAHMLKDWFEKRNHKFIYTGLDFSIEAVMKARETASMTGFYKADCLDPKTYEKYIGNPHCIIAMEIFEHTDDLKILSLLPKDKFIIATVPDFDDPAHIRHFKTIEEVQKRYQDSINLIHIEKVQRWYIISGTTK